MRIKRLAIIGVGLIGGSLALALKKAGGVDTVIGVGRSKRNLDDALRLGVVDEVSFDIPEAVTGADIVVIAVPVGSIEGVCAAIDGHLSDGAVVTDVGSTKQSVLDQVESSFGVVPDWFVPGHPIAGTENSGAAAAFAELYENRKVVLTPLETTHSEALEKIRTMWQQTGAVVEELSVDLHDAILAASSHLPHVLAFGLVDYLSSSDHASKTFHYAAGGFEDFTRIASSDPQMWTDICIGNRQAIAESIKGYQQHLSELVQVIEQSDSTQIHKIFSHAKKTRDSHNDHE